MSELYSFVRSEAMGNDFFSFMEHLLEDQIPEQLKNILLLAGYSCKTAFINAPPQTWIEDIEIFIRSQSECEYYRRRMHYDLCLRNFSLPPGYKSVLMGIKSKLEMGVFFQNERIDTPGICIRQELPIQAELPMMLPSTSANQQNPLITQKPQIQISLEDAKEILESILKSWRVNHQLQQRINYSLSNKLICTNSGESINKVTATIICPDCKRSIPVHMDPSKSWVIANFVSHFDVMHYRNNALKSDNTTLNAVNVILSDYEDITPVKEEPLQKTDPELDINFEQN